MIIAISGKIGSGKDTVGSIIQYLTDYKSLQYTHPITEQDYKSYLRNNHNKYSNWQIKKFAYKLKQVVSLLTSIPVEDLEKQEVKDKVLGEEWSFDKQFKPATVDEDTPMVEYTRKLPTVRWMLQRVGTEAMRNQIHENVWVNALFADYKETYESGSLRQVDDSRKYLNWIITDLRFPNELKAVEDRDGITIRINRDIISRGLSNSDVSTVITNIKNEHPSETALDNAQFKYTIDNNGTIEELVEKVKEILILEKII